MQTARTKEAPLAMVVLAFATVYLVWGSTYLFIQQAVHDFPPMVLGAIRFIAAGIILFAWCAIKKEKLWNLQQVKTAAITGVLLLFVGNGAVIWSEQHLPSSLVAVLVSAAPIWFVVLDRPLWKENFRSRSVLAGLAVGFAGVILLFGEQVAAMFNGQNGVLQVAGVLILLVGSISWAGGSLYSKYNGTGTATVNTAWQMTAAGIAFGAAGLVNHEWSGFHLLQVSAGAWWSLVYLVTMGSLAGFSAYVWLLQVRPVTQVSTYAYVNPVVAVVLGVLFAGEHLTSLQLAGLGVILASVLLINLAKYRGNNKKLVAAGVQVKPA